MKISDLRERICDTCLAWVQAQGEEYAILYTDLCPACQVKCERWADEILDQVFGELE